MPDNSQFEIQTSSLISLVPRIKELNNLLEKPMISDEMIQTYMSLPPAQRQEWIKNNTNTSEIENQINNMQKINSIMNDLVEDISSIMGTRKVQNVMQAQQQQNLQAAQKPTTQATTQATAPVESLE